MKIFVASLLLILSNQLLAQKFLEAEHYKWKAGIEFGGNVFHLGNDTIVKSTALGWNVGVTAEYEVNDWFSVRSGIYFNQTHQYYSAFDTVAFKAFGLDTLLGEDVKLLTYKTERNHVQQFYFRIPLMASFNWKGLGLFGGPYFGLNFKARKDTYSTESSPWTEVIDFTQFDPSGQLALFLPKAFTEDLEISNSRSPYNLIDFGFQMGIRYQLKRFGVNFGYNIAMLDYRNADLGDPVKHQYFYGSMNYLIGFGKRKGEAVPRN